MRLAWTLRVKEIMSESNTPRSSDIDPVYIREYLTDKGICCESVAHDVSLTLEVIAEQLFIPLHQFARAQLLRDGKGYAMAILPLASHLDFASIKSESGREFEMAWPEEYAALFSHLHSKSIPPLSGLYDMDCFIDSALVKNDVIYLPDGSAQCLLKLSADDFLALQGSPHIIPLAVGLTGSAAPTGIGISNKAREMREKIATLDSLPAMPDVASELLTMSRDPETMPEDIARVIETDPAIVAQIMHYARSPWYGYKGEIASVKDAIFSVLGMDMVTNLALGMAAGKVFKNTAQGKLSAANLWQHAVYSAALTEALARSMPVRMKMKPGMAYLTGLLHKIGFMILSHCFPEEFQKLAEEVDANPTASIMDIEQQLYGLTHAEVAAELMRRWDLPEKVIQVMRHHHDEDYSGDCKQDVLLVQLANGVLANMNIGDAESIEIDARLYDELGITEQAVDEVVETLFSQQTSELDQMAALLAA